MPTWDELFKLGARIEGVEPEVARASQIISETFKCEPGNINMWDIGCGNGRHALFLARLGVNLYASDNSPTALEMTRKALAAERLSATFAEADMEVAPFGNTMFHGIVIWNVIQHATAEKIRRVFSTILDHLLPGGLMVLSVKSSRAEEA
nr:class I SAM-dependent methyltransferase [Candidatus Sigynarchaeota archaeon]